MGKVPPRFLACATGWDDVSISQNTKGTSRFEFGGPLRQLAEVLDKCLAIFGGVVTGLLAITI